MANISLSTKEELHQVGWVSSLDLIVKVAGDDRALVSQLYYFSSSGEYSFPHRQSGTGLIGLLAPVLSRYISVLVFIIGNYLHWAGDRFSEHYCRGFWFLPAVFKCTQLT